MNRIISISGRKGSGKDLVSNIIQMLTADGVYGQKAEYLEFLAENPLGALGCHEDEAMNWVGDYNSLGKWKIKKFADKLKNWVCDAIGCTREQLEDQVFKNTPLGDEWSLWIVTGKGEFKTYTYEFLDEKKALYFYSNRKDTFSKSEAVFNFVFSKPIKKQLTPRKFLQVLGTDCGRNLIHPQIWVNATFADYNTDNFWIISDTRFPNEIEAVKKRHGITIKVARYKTSAEWYKDISHICKIITPESWDTDNYEFSWNEELIPQDVFIKRLLNSECSRGEAFADWLDSFYHESETSLDNYNDWDYVIHNNGTIEDLIVKVKNILKTENELN